MKKMKLTIILITLVILAIAAGLGRHYAARQTAAAPAPAVSAAQAILVDGKTGKVLYERNADEKAYPASTTKIMTALLVLETLEQYDSPIDQKVAVPKEAVGVEGSSLYLKEGEKISLQDLLYGLMLRSGNDAAVALAAIAAGNVDLFVQQMNDKAIKLHCKNTHFVNPNGLFDENHYTTVRDMSIIAREAMTHKAFRTIVAAKSWDADREESEFNHFYNKNKTVHQFKGGTGIKIGFTKASGRTLVASSERNGKELICVVMGAPNWFGDILLLLLEKDVNAM